jgi:hypothetical protein
VCELRLIGSRHGRNVSRPAVPSFPLAQPRRPASGPNAAARGGRLGHDRSWTRDGQAEGGQQRPLPRATPRPCRNLQRPSFLPERSQRLLPSPQPPGHAAASRRDVRDSPVVPLIRPVVGKSPFRGRPPHPCSLLSGAQPWRLGPCRVAPASFNKNFPLAFGHSSRSLRGKIPEPPERRGC